MTKEWSHRHEFVQFRREVLPVSCCRRNVTGRYWFEVRIELIPSWVVYWTMDGGGPSVDLAVFRLFHISTFKVSIHVVDD